MHLEECLPYNNAQEVFLLPLLFLLTYIFLTYTKHFRFLGTLSISLIEMLIFSNYQPCLLHWNLAII